MFCVPQRIAKFDEEKENVLSSARGEFTKTMESLASKHSALMNQLNEARLKLAEAQSEHEAAEKQWKSRVEEDSAKIHAR